ncbi:amidohydrolase family protein [Candidatus Parcubacteria bacterium]|nr:amidohydrolase family protein [Candidatus Parcubacteria bacterium]
MTHFNQENLGLLALEMKMDGTKARGFLISAGSPADKAALAPLIEELAKLGVRLYATEGTSRFLNERGIKNEAVCRISDDCEPNPRSLILNGTVDLVINILTGDADYDNQRSDSRQIRALAAERLIPVFTDLDVSVATIRRLLQHAAESPSVVGPADYDFWAYFDELVKERGGLWNDHAHLDRAGTLSRQHFALGHAKMTHKWDLVREVKLGYTHDGLVRRMSHFVDRMIAQGIHTCRTFIDADTTVGFRVLQATLDVKRRYADRFRLEFGIQPLEGLTKPESREIYLRASEPADFMGALPSRDNPHPEEHLDFVMSYAREYRKPVYAHVDQRNHPDERETEQLIDMTLKHGLQGRVTAVHAISVAAKPKHIRDGIIRRMVNARLKVVVCPSAAISMEQLDNEVVPTHNSIVPVISLVEAGVPVSIGTDNIHDLFMPASSGDLRREIWMLAEATRCYDVPLLADIACNKLAYAEK